RIREEKVPVAGGATLEQALYGGEEYELVFTVPAGKLEKLMNVKLKAGITVVGEIAARKKGIKLIDACGKIKPLKETGYEHFKNG
ncbi:hypothetical protein HZB08_02805, partial [Candidatus Saganbacteria bacterium]|nr:hypothetical protein [Candidatus Saganbacteria bacterium]